MNQNTSTFFLAKEYIFCNKRMKNKKNFGHLSVSLIVLNAKRLMLTMNFLVCN